MAKVSDVELTEVTESKEGAADPGPRREPVIVGGRPCWLRGEEFEKDMAFRQEYYSRNPRKARVGWISQLSADQYKKFIFGNSLRDWFFIIGCLLVLYVIVGGFFYGWLTV